MVTPSVLGAATGVGLALFAALSLLIYRYYSRDRKPGGERTTRTRSLHRPEARAMAGQARRHSTPRDLLLAQNFSIFREQPKRTSSPPAFLGPSSSLSTQQPPTSGQQNRQQPPAGQRGSLDQQVHVRLSLPDVHLPDDCVSPSQSSYSLPLNDKGRRSSLRPMVSRARSVDARALPRLSISDRSDSVTSSSPPPATTSSFPRTQSPEQLSPFFGTGAAEERPSSPGGLRPRSLSPLLAPSSTVLVPVDPAAVAGAASPLGALQPHLYKRQGLLVLHGQSQQGTARLHFRLKYDFNRSDLVVHVIEAVELGTLTEKGFNDPSVRVSMNPQVDSKQRQTELCRNSTDPQFDEVFKFPVSFDDLPEKTLLFQVFDYDRFSRNDVTGEVRVPLAEVDVATEVEVWSEITKMDKNCAERPEILLSLSYLPSAGRLTVVVLKASNLQVPGPKDTPDSYVKVHLQVGEKKCKKKKKTTTKKGSRNPVWNEALSFDVAEDELRLAQLNVSVVQCHGATPLLGACALGPQEKAQQAGHWRDMLANPRKSIAMWHPLQL